MCKKKSIGLTYQRNNPNIPHGSDCQKAFCFNVHYIENCNMKCMLYYRFSSNAYGYALVLFLNFMIRHSVGKKSLMNIFEFYIKRESEEWFPSLYCCRNSEKVAIYLLFLNRITVYSTQKKVK